MTDPCGLTQFKGLRCLADPSLVQPLVDRSVGNTDEVCGLRWPASEIDGMSKKEVFCGHNPILIENFVELCLKRIFPSITGMAEPQILPVL
jgi:hypothetical protein